jgi:hypothetical protein
MAMNTTVAFGNGYQGSSDRKILLLLPTPIRKAPEPEFSIVRLPSTRTHPEVAEVRVPVPEPAIWERLELVLVVVLALAVIISVILFFAAAGNV